MPDTARCLLCQPPEPMETGAIRDHMRLFHPDHADPGEPVPDNPDRPFTRQVMTDAEVGDHGAQCMDCGRALNVGHEYVDRLVAFTSDGTPVTEIVCVPCGEVCHGPDRPRRAGPEDTPACEATHAGTEEDREVRQRHSDAPTSTPPMTPAHVWVVYDHYLFVQTCVGVCASELSALRLCSRPGLPPGVLRRSMQRMEVQP